MTWVEFTEVLEEDFDETSLPFNEIRENFLKHFEKAKTDSTFAAELAAFLTYKSEKTDEWSLITIYDEWATAINNYYLQRDACEWLTFDAIRYRTKIELDRR